MPNPCAFCGRTDRTITREHIFASWVDKLFPEAAAVNGTSIIIARDGSRKEYQSYPFEQKVRVVCDLCNNGWMSRLETAVAPLLAPMVRNGGWTRLARGVQQIIATWAMKTAFMLQHLHSTERIIPDAEYYRFYAEQKPLQGYIIWLGHRVELIDHTGIPLIFASREQLIEKVSYTGTVTPEDIHQALEEGGRVYRITFTLGHVVFVIFGHTFPGKYNVGISEALARVIRPIWPTGRRTTWPPPSTVDQMGGIDALHKAFENW